MLPETIYLRRGHIRAHFGLSQDEFDDLVAAGIFTPHYLPVANATRLPEWRRRRLPKVKRAVFLRAEVVQAERTGRIATTRSAA